MKAKLFLGLALSTLMLNSCQTEKVDEIIGKAADQNKQIDVCIDKTLNTNLGGKGGTLNGYNWANGQTVRVKFLNGTHFDRSKVVQYAVQWMEFANINLVFVTSGDAEIRINFDSSNQYWSYLGTDSTSIAQNVTSMNFGWVNKNKPESEFSRLVLHEFGHALNLIHEQSSPKQNISWNKQVVYDYFAKAPTYWTSTTVNEAVFYRYSLTQTNSSSYDPKSIMHQAVDPSWTTDGYSVGWNTVLSDTDKWFIASVYPYPAGAKKVATFCKHPNFNNTDSGYAISLPIGNYTLSQLQARGIMNDDLSSVIVNPGYEVEFFLNDYFQGNQFVCTTNTGGFNWMDNNISSLKVRVKS